MKFEIRHSYDKDSRAGQTLLRLIHYMLNGFIVFGVIMLIAAIVTLILFLCGRMDRYYVPIACGALGAGFTLVTLFVRWFINLIFSIIEDPDDEHPARI